MTRQRPDVRASLRAGRTDWYRISNLVPTTATISGSAEVMIYDEIGYFGITANDFVRDVEALNVETISLRINSPGGEVFDGVAIHNALRNHKATVHVTVDGLAASAASFIAMAGDRITMARGSQMMIHEGNCLGIGNASDMRALAERLDRVSDDIAGFYAERAGGTVASWRERMRAETWYNADEAVAAGLADDTARDVKPADEDVRNAWDLSVFAYAGRAEAPVPELRDASTPPVPVPPLPPAPNLPTPTPQVDNERVTFVYDPEIFRQAMAASVPDASAGADIKFADIFRNAFTDSTDGGSQ